MNKKMFIGLEQLDEKLIFSKPMLFCGEMVKFGFWPFFHKFYLKEANMRYVLNVSGRILFRLSYNAKI